MNENRKLKDEKRQTPGLRRFSFFVFCVSFVILAGCSSHHPTTRPMTADERQNAALRDPMGYKVNMDETDNISGGGISNYDRKAMRKDINDVLNP
jgi:hypothetical protein